MDAYKLLTSQIKDIGVYDPAAPEASNPIQHVQQEPLQVHITSSRQPRENICVFAKMNVIKVKHTARMNTQTWLHHVKANKKNFHIREYAT